MSTHSPGKGSVAAAVGGSFLVAAAVLWWPGNGRPLAEALAIETASGPAPESNDRVAAAPVRSTAGASTATSPTLSLETVGEIVLPNGSVERVYRVRVVNDGQWRSRVEAGLLHAGPGVTVVEGRAELGDLAPGARMLSADTVTLRHAPDVRIESAQLRWQFGEIAGSDAGGTMLSGAANELAINALRDYDSKQKREPTGAATRFTSHGPANPEMSAVIAGSATVGQVNSALRQTGAVITQMHPGSPSVTLMQSSPAENESPRSVAGRLQESGAFEWVRPRSEANPGQSEPLEAALPDAEPEFDDHRPR